MNTLKVGDKAPHFKLVDQDNELIALSDFQGQKVLLYFYPKAMTPGCTLQAVGLRDSMEILRALGITVLGISSDSPKKLQQFVEKEMLNFSLLSDSDHQVSEQFGVWGEKSFMGKQYNGIHRISFLINEQGVIEQVFSAFKPVEHHEHVLRYLGHYSATP